jgi:prevent-host-death family protein
MILPTDIETLDNFKRRSKRQIHRLRQTGRPTVLTVNGKPAVVVQDAAAYQRQMERLMQLDVIEAVREGAADADAGRVEDAARFFKRLRGTRRGRA